VVTAVIDTSALFPDCTLASVRAQMLLRWTHRGSYDLTIPEVVVLEMVQDARERLQQAERSVEKGQRICAELGLVTDVRSINVDGLVEEAEANLRRKITQARGSIAAIPGPGHRELVDRSIVGCKPFNRPSQGSKEASDRGYRDTLIWLNARALAMAGDHVVLVTENTKDFADHGALHPELLHDVEQSNAGGRVELCLGLDQFLKDHLPIDADVLNAIQTGLADDDAFLDTVVEFVGPTIGKAAVAMRSRVDFARPFDTSQGAYTSPEAVAIGDTKIVSVTALDAYGFDEDNVGAVTLEITAEIAADLVFARSDAEWLAHLGSSVEFEDWDSMETAVAGSTTVNVTATGDLLFDKSDKSLVDFDVSDIVSDG
jgi:PIN domain